MTTKISSTLSKLIIWILVSFGNDCLACLPDLQVDDSVNIKALSTSNGNRTGYKEAGSNFYKEDSIFSFRSPKGYIPSLLTNFGEQITSPLRFDRKDWIITGATVGITIALFHFDNDIDNWATVQKQKHGWVNVSSPVITQFGSTYGISTVAVIGVISAAFNNKKGVQTSLLATQAWITSAAWVQLIKHFTGREDPSAAYIYSKMPGGKWWGPFSQYDQDIYRNKSVSSFDAFPSGHTAAAFSIATVFATQYSNTAVIPILSYSMATLVGISRLTEHQHWASDIVVGGLIGYACGRQVVAHFKKIHQTPDNSLSPKSSIKKEFTIIQNGNQFGFSLKW